MRYLANQTEGGRGLHGVLWYVLGAASKGQAAHTKTKKGRAGLGVVVFLWPLWAKHCRNKKKKGEEERAGGAPTTEESSGGEGGGRLDLIPATKNGKKQKGKKITIARRGGGSRRKHFPKMCTRG